MMEKVLTLLRSISSKKTREYKKLDNCGPSTMDCPNEDTNLLISRVCEVDGDICITEKKLECEKRNSLNNYINNARKNKKSTICL